MLLSNKRITKMLIRLSGCAGWSVPLLFANPEDRFSCEEAHMISNKSSITDQTRVLQAFYNSLEFVVIIQSAIMVKSKNSNYDFSRIS